VNQRKHASPFLCFCLAVSFLLLAGCKTPRKPLPEQTSIPTLGGFPSTIRCYLNLEKNDLRADLHPFLRGLDLTGGEDGVFNLLQLSGGGEYGAFGAGVLNGWTASGKRPEFDMVTGISTGALSAPFAFLGEAYDDILTGSYTDVSAWDIFQLRGLSSLIVMPSSAVSSKPLEAMISELISLEVMDAIAEQHSRGRRLYMATFYLDDQQFVVWDIGAIAKVGGKEALELIHKVMLASASIPLAFPPVVFDVELDGETYDEMHVDGGVFSSTVGIELLLRSELAIPASQRNLHYIINWPIASKYEAVERSIGSIGFRTIASLLKNQHRWDLFRTSMSADLLDFKLGYHKVPDQFPDKEGLPFDSDYMNLLYEAGFQLGKDTNSWLSLDLVRR